MGHMVEVFVTNCPLCREALENVKKAVCPHCTLKVYNVLENPEHIEKIKAYNIRAIPAIVIDGKEKFEGVPELKELRRILGQH